MGALHNFIHEISFSSENEFFMRKPGRMSFSLAQ
jgi:hypothetical protein